MTIIRYIRSDWTRPPLPICNQPKTGRNPFLCAACVAREYTPVVDPKKEKKK